MAALTARQQPGTSAGTELPVGGPIAAVAAPAALAASAAPAVPAVPAVPADAERRAAVVSAAARVFARDGFAAASLREVAGSAGTDLAGLKAHFRTKDDLARGVIVEQNRRMVAALDQALLRHGPVEALIHASRAVADQLRGGDAVLRAGVRLGVELGWTEPLVAAQHQGWVEHVSGLLARAQESGDVSDGLDAGELGATVVAYFTGVHTMSAMLTGRGDLHARLVVMWRTTIDAIVPIGRRIGLHTVTRDAFGAQLTAGLRVVAGAA